MGIWGIFFGNNDDGDDGSQADLDRRTQQGMRDATIHKEKDWKGNKRDVAATDSWDFGKWLNGD